MASLKTKGDLAELKVATDLIERGYRIAGVVVPEAIDVDRPCDVVVAERLLQ